MFFSVLFFRATAVQLTQPSPIVMSEMEQAALDRMAKSIAQLTLCQVTSEKLRLPPNF